MSLLVVLMLLNPLWGYHTQDSQATQAYADALHVVTHCPTSQDLTTRTLTYQNTRVRVDHQLRNTLTSTEAHLYVYNVKGKLVLWAVDDQIIHYKAGGWRNNLRRVASQCPSR